MKKPLLGLGALGRGRLQFGTKNPVPEAASNTKSVLEIRIVVLEVVLLESLVVRWQAGASQYALY